MSCRCLVVEALACLVQAMVQLEVALDEEVDALEQRGCEAKREEVLPEHDNAMSVVWHELLLERAAGRCCGDDRACEVHDLPQERDLNKVERKCFTLVPNGRLFRYQSRDHCT